MTRIKLLWGTNIIIPYGKLLYITYFSLVKLNGNVVLNNRILFFVYSTHLGVKHMFVVINI